MNHCGRLEEARRIKHAQMLPPRARHALREQVAVVRALLDEVERLAPSEANAVRSEQLVEELARIGCRCLELAAEMAPHVTPPAVGHGTQSAEERFRVDWPLELGGGNVTLEESAMQQEDVMAATGRQQVERSINEAANEIEALASEIELKVALATMDARETWNAKLAPKLFEARMHAREAREASRAALHETLQAFREFSAIL